MSELKLSPVLLSDRWRGGRLINRLQSCLQPSPTKLIPVFIQHGVRALVTLSSCQSRLARSSRTQRLAKVVRFPVTDSEKGQFSKCECARAAAAGQKALR